MIGAVESIMLIRSKEFNDGIEHRPCVARTIFEEQRGHTFCGSAIKFMKNEDVTTIKEAKHPDSRICFRCYKQLAKEGLVERPRRGRSKNVE